MLLLALLSFAEQTALNSMTPYLPSMVLGFSEIPPDQVGMYVGMLASSFALAQLSTNFFWGYLSDRVGRKPVLITGTSLLAGCFLAFGFCKTYWQAMLVQIAMGMLNGNAGVVPSALGDITDRSNQSTAFTWLPILYSLGNMTGPGLGGLLVGLLSEDYPYLAANLASAGLLAVSGLIVGLWLEEPKDEVPGLHWSIGSVRKHLPGHESSASPLLSNQRNGPNGASSARNIPSSTAGEEDSHESDDFDRREESGTDEESQSGQRPTGSWRDVMNRSTIALLCTYLVYHLSNISFNSLFPIFASAPPPAGRGLKPATIGVSISIAGAFTIIFQALLFQPIKSRLGNLRLYRWALLGLAVSMGIMPWIGYPSSSSAALDIASRLGVPMNDVWLYTELGISLILKNMAAISGLSCVMLLITNSATSDSNLGTLNGLAQTISAAGRSIGPFLSGGVFSVASGVHPKGEALAWGVFAGICLVGWLGTFAIDGARLESDDDSGGSEE